MTAPTNSSGDHEADQQTAHTVFNHVKSLPVKRIDGRHDLLPFPTIRSEAELTQEGCDTLEASVDVGATDPLEVAEAMLYAMQRGALRAVALKEKVVNLSEQNASEAGTTACKATTTFCFCIAFRRCDNTLKVSARIEGSSLWSASSR